MCREIISEVNKRYRSLYCMYILYFYTYVCLCSWSLQSRIRKYVSWHLFLKGYLGLRKQLASPFVVLYVVVIFRFHDYLPTPISLNSWHDNMYYVLEIVKFDGISKLLCLYRSSSTGCSTKDITFGKYICGSHGLKEMLRYTLEGPGYWINSLSWFPHESLA